MYSQIVFLVCLLGAVSCVDYCKLRCGASHTMCKYPDRLGSSCVGYVNAPLTQADKDYLLQLHNEARNNVAGGSLQASLNLPKAANMRQMVWDSEIETIASRWAKQCVFQHDTCRDSDRFYVGQNLAFQGTTGSMDRKTVLKAMFDGWFKESVDTTPSHISAFPRSTSKPIGHFTQQVWAQSTQLGCALTTTFDGKWNKWTLVCNYGPGGNMIGSPVYQSGTPASKCPANTSKSSTYANLCA